MISNRTSADDIDFRRRIVRKFALSRHAEQGLVRDYFGGSSEGVFVEVGANDPRINSQSYHLDALGWTGLLVEPLPHLAERLRNERRAQVAEYAASSRKRHRQKMLLVGTGAHSRLTDTHAGEQPDSKAPARMVECRTLDSLLEDHNIQPGFNFLSIDVEGHEPDLLDGFYVERWRPNLILIEDNGTELTSHRTLSRKGYQLILRTGRNNWYVPKERHFRMGAAAAWQSFRKLCLGLWPRRAKRAVQSFAG